MRTSPNALSPVAESRKTMLPLRPVSTLLKSPTQRPAS